MVYNVLSKSDLDPYPKTMGYSMQFQKISANFEDRVALHVIHHSMRFDATNRMVLLSARTELLTTSFGSLQVWSVDHVVTVL